MSISLFSKQVENISQDELEKRRQWYAKLARTYPSYNYTVNYARLTSTCKEVSEAADFGREFARTLSFESDRDINQDLRLVEIEKDLVPIVENTDNNVFYRPLFFPSIFFNNDFRFEDLIIKGIYITECYAVPGESIYQLRTPNPNDYAIFSVACDINQGCEFYSSIALINKAIGAKYTDSKEEDKKTRRLTDYIRILVCNILDMIEGNDELTVTTIVSTKEHNEKRKRKGQIPFPDKVFIRATGEFKKYISSYNREISKPSHSFEVRAHWRHFRDNRFVNMKGQKIWIKPMIKGKGIFIKKDYKVIKGHEGDDNENSRNKYI